MNVLTRYQGPLFAFAVSVASAACAQAGGEVQAPLLTAQTQPSLGTRCPMARLNGVNATVADAPMGVSIRFTGPSSTVDQLRANVHSMDDANGSGRDPFAVCACARPYRNEGATEAMPESTEAQSQARWNDSSMGTSGPSGPSPGNNASAPGQPETEPGAYDAGVQSHVDETVAGAVLTLTAKDAGSVQGLRNRARLDIRAMQAGCMGTPARP
jgi:hypothetical protein